MVRGKKAPERETKLQESQENSYRIEEAYLTFAFTF